MKGFQTENLWWLLTCSNSAPGEAGSVAVRSTRKLAGRVATAMRKIATTAARPMSIFLIIIVWFSLIVVQLDFVSRANAPIHRYDEQRMRRRTGNAKISGSDIDLLLKSSTLLKLQRARFHPIPITLISIFNLMRP